MKKIVLFGALALAGIACGAPPELSVGAPPGETESSSVSPIVAPPPTAGEQISDAATVTGYKIGDPVNYSAPRPNWITPDGQIDPAKVPKWLAVSSNGIVVGYKRTDVPPPAPTSPNAGRTYSVLIYDEIGQVVGQFVDGLPMIGPVEAKTP
ncbi:MAG: hypothetical protein AAB131_06835 [Actinomycetota bacterium]